MCFLKAAGAVAFSWPPSLVSLLKYTDILSVKEIAIEISWRTSEAWNFYLLGTQDKTISQDLLDFCSFREVLRLVWYRDHWKAADFLLHDTLDY